MSKVVNMLDAKSSLSQLVQQVEQGTLEEVIIARNGKPAARLVPLAAEQLARHRRIGVAEGRFTAPADLDEQNDEVRRLIEGA